MRVFNSTITFRNAFFLLRDFKIRIVSYKRCYGDFWYDFLRYSKFSWLNVSSPSRDSLVGRIIVQYHVIEKGLTMPSVRLGFGQARVVLLCNLCLSYKKRFSLESEQVEQAVRVLLEYQMFHFERNFPLSNDLLDLIKSVGAAYSLQSGSSQNNVDKKSFFLHSNSSFKSFSKSRRSVRNYDSKELPVSILIEAFDIARNTPSACNRQPIRNYVFTDKEKIKKVLDVQGGTRGFSHKVNKLIVVVCEVGVYASGGERNLCFVDGGMYLMNLLYALHYLQVAACPLNGSFTKEVDQVMRKLCEVKPSEVFVGLITCGYAPDEFSITDSLRYDIFKTYTIVT